MSLRELGRRIDDALWHPTPKADLFVTIALVIVTAGYFGLRELFFLATGR
jgi:hypothetical protein